MRKWLTRVVAGVLACASMLSIAACGSNGDKAFSEFLESVGGAGDSAGGNGGGAIEKVIDPTKTQLLVKTYTAGFGDEWMYDLEARFEEAYKNVSYEDGKTGIQVWHTGDMKSNYTAQDIIAGSYDVYFMENASYYALTKEEGALENLTDIVTTPNADDGGKTILSKLTQQQKSFYGRTGTDGDPKYYAIPHYEGGWGLIYNKELFDAKNYYMADVPAGEGARIVADANETKGKGPDGVAGTSDDGLPRTYEEFFILCDEIAARGDIPFCWSGQYREPYLTTFMNSLVAEYCGVDQMELNLTFEGEAEELVVFDENGAIVYENGEVKTERLAITPASGAEISRQAGKLYALQFLEKMLTTDGYFNKKTSLNATHSHTAAQENFLKAGTKFSTEKSAYAMLIDGPWWEAEATSVYTLMGIQDANYTKKNRDFAWMPMPKATEAKVGTKNIYIDTLNAITCVKSGLGPKKQAALDFVKFSATDESLIKFTQITGALKSFNYTLNEEQKSVLSPFAQSVINYKETAATFVMNSGNDFYVSNTTAFNVSSYYPSTGGWANPVACFNAGEKTSEEYFKDMVAHWRNASIWG